MEPFTTAFETHVFSLQFTMPKARRTSSSSTPNTPVSNNDVHIVSVQVRREEHEANARQALFSLLTTFGSFVTITSEETDLIAPDAPQIPTASDDISANLHPETYAKLDASLHNPLLAALRAAHAANIENFNLEEFVRGLDGDIETISRNQIYSATAEIGLQNQKNTHQSTDDQPATPAQRRTIERFKLNPDHYPTKGEASGIISAFIERIEKRKASNDPASNSTPASPA